MRSFRRALAHVLVFSLVVAFIGLGLWQIRRHGERRAANARITSRMSHPPAALDRLLAESRGDFERIRYRRARISGRFDISEEMVLLSRSFRGISGNHLVTPLVTEDGTAVLVDRGWVPLVVDEPGAEEALPPSGEVTVEGVVFPSQIRLRFGPLHPASGDLEEIFRVDIPRLRPQLPYEVAPVFVLLQSQTPPQSDRLPRPDVIPQPEAGPHIGYAIQWFAFAIILAAGYIVLLRAKRAAERDEPPGVAPEGSRDDRILRDPD
ncbi:MAG TPA: SURF1 family protein [Actinomycetota bacterium]|nr:SURF1 family protein [Actinomycetota bacterium]